MRVLRRSDPGRRVPLRQRRQLQWLVLTLLLGLVWLLLVFTGVARRLEEGPGLELLFALRGLVQAPADVEIVSIDRFSAERFGLSPVAPWPRRLHACLVERLSAAGASLIVFDVFFRPGGGSQAGDEIPRTAYAACPGVRAGLDAGIGDDTLLARALAAHGRVLLLERLVRERVSVQGALAVVDRRELPEPMLLREALGTAPFLLPTDTARLVAFQPFIPLMGELRPSLARLAADHSLGRATAVPTPPARELYLKVFGPAGQVCTRAFARVLGVERLGVSAGCGDAEDYRGKVVFVGAGWSPIASVDEPDAFDTLYAAPGQRIGGVELLATAFANLRAGDAIHPAPLITAAAWVALCTLVVGALVLGLPRATGLPAALVVALLYVLHTQAALVQAQRFYPVAVPLLVLFPLAIFGAFLIKYLAARRAVQRYVPLQVAERVARASTPSELPREIEAVCLCSDVVGYTSLAERLAPNDLATLTNAYFDGLVGRVLQRRGELVDIVGDGMNCFWPVGCDPGRSRVDACLAALDLLREVDAFNQRHPGRPFATRIGLHWGRVAVGDVGGQGRFRYSLVGDTANTASRIEGLSKRLGTRLLASADVVAGVTRFAVRPLGSFRLKGKSEALAVVEILGESTTLDGNSRQQLDAFAQALALYEQGDWEAARDAFARVLQHWPADGPARFYQRLCCDRVAAPDAGELTSVVVMDDK